MTSYWSTQGSGQKNLLRLLTPEGNWLQWDDQPPSEGASSTAHPGCHARVEETLLSALHSTNVMVLLGSGASFCAKNDAPKPNAPGMWDLWEAVNNAANKETEFEFQKIYEKYKDVKNIEKLLSICKINIELLSSQDNETKDINLYSKFVKLSEKTILDKVDFVNSETQLPAHKDLIRKLSRRSADKPRVKLFTTNYDLCLEMAASRLGAVLIDGFSHTAEQRFNRDHFHYDIVRRSAHSAKAEYLDAVFHLYKLHGSVDWRRKKDGTIFRSTEEINEDITPVLIYPRSSKYQEAFAPPYLDMFAALQAALREPDTTLIISGFGFADDHISQPIWSAVESNLSLRIILCDTGFIGKLETGADGTENFTAELDDTEHEIKSGQVKGEYQNKFIELVKRGDTRITLLNGRFEDLAQAIPEIQGKTDRQLLVERLENLKAGIST